MKKKIFILFLPFLKIHVPTSTISREISFSFENAKWNNEPTTVKWKSAPALKEIECGWKNNKFSWRSNLIISIFSSPIFLFKWWAKKRKSSMRQNDNLFFRCQDYSSQRHKFNHSQDVNLVSCEHEFIEN
jgi:hypothetical protein